MCHHICVHVRTFATRNETHDLLRRHYDLLLQSIDVHTAALLLPDLQVDALRSEQVVDHFIVDLEIRHLQRR